jgi:hypothetical protein
MFPLGYGLLCLENLSTASLQQCRGTGGVRMLVKSNR